MRLGKKERMTLRLEQALRDAQASRNARVNPNGRPVSSANKVVPSGSRWPERWGRSRSVKSGQTFTYV